MSEAGRKWCVMDLVVGADGKLVLTKVQASCFHLALFLTVCFITYRKGEFVDSMWALYAAVAVGHAVVDKTAAQVQAYKTKQLETNTQAPREG
jgi:hypothetical protein